MCYKKCYKKVFVFAVLFLAGVCPLLACGKPGAKSVDSPQPADLAPVEHTHGDPAAPILLIEYSALTCGHCAQFHKKVRPKIEKEWVNTGKVHHVVREYPMDPVSLNLALIVFAPEHSNNQKAVLRGALLNSQEKWLLSKKPQEKALNLLLFGGVSPEQADKALKNEELKKRLLNQRLVAAQTYKIDATPTFLIMPKGGDVRDAEHIPGNQSYGRFVRAFEKFTKK